MYFNPDAALPRTGDPAVTFDSEGNAYFVFLAFKADLSDSAIFIYKSSDGGQTWINPLNPLLQPPLKEGSETLFVDRPRVTVDRSGKRWPPNNPDQKESIYVVWAEFDRSPPFSFTNGRIVLRYSRDGGSAFSSPASGSELSDPVNANGAAPVVDHNGYVYVAWYEFFAPQQIRIARSVDGGVNFPTSDRRTVSTVTPLPQNLGSGSGSNQTPFIKVAMSHPSIAVDTSGGPFHGRIYVVWHEEIRQW